jgi:hypothetical protein
MKFKLTIAERIALLNILPGEGNLITLRIIRELQTVLSFSEMESKQFKITSHPTPGSMSGYVTWDAAFNTTTKEIEIGEVARGIIVGQLKMIEEKKKLRMEMVDLYEKFVGKDRVPSPQS